MIIQKHWSGKFIRGLTAVALACVIPLGGVAHALDELTIAYFLEWPTPNQVAQLEETYDKELGVKVNWKAFGSGNDMSAAMASGDVQIAYSQGLIPFIIAVSKGLPLKTVGIAVSYAEADNCVVHKDAGLDRSSKTSIGGSLRGMKIATPVANVTHYKLLKTLDHFGVSSDDVSIVPVSGGNDAAAAFLTGQVDIGCAFGGPLDKMKAQGEVLMSGAEQEAIGILTFDVISVTEEFANDYPDMLVKFLQITEDANKNFASNKDAHWATLAEASGINEADVKGYLGDNGSFYFPTRAEQLSDAWMGGNVQQLTKNAADFFVEQEVMSKALDNYDSTIDSSFIGRVQ